MRRLLLPAAALSLLLVVLLLIGSALARPGPASPDGGQLRVEQVDTGAYPEITLYVSALDESSAPRDDLQADDFVITEDGAPVELAGFSGAGGASVATLLVVDRSGSMDDDAKIEGAREAAAAFVELLRPGDRAALLGFNADSSLLAEFTADKDELNGAIERLRPDGGTALYDAVVAGVDLLREQRGRTLLLVLTDGQDCSSPFDSCPPEFGSEATLDEAIAYAQAAGQPLAVVGLGDPSADGIDEAVLQQLADETGGRYLYAPRADELAGLYAELAAAVQREYRLVYVSPRPFYDGTRRDIQVEAAGFAAVGGYTERHLINVDSNPLVGLVLLVPLLGLLALPAALRRRGAPRPMVGTYQPEGAPPVLVAAGGPTVAPAPAPDPSTIVAGTRRCVSCDAPLRVTARFCSRCGAVQGA